MINLAVILFLMVLSIMDIKTFNKKHEGIPSILTTAFCISFEVGTTSAFEIIISI